MASRLNPYITFADGSAREAMTFYADVFGGDLTLSTFGEYGDDRNPEGIMHAQLEAGALTFMGADTPPEMPSSAGDSISMSLSGDDVEELRSELAQAIADEGPRLVEVGVAPGMSLF